MKKRRDVLEWINKAEQDYQTASVRLGKGKILFLLKKTQKK